MPFARSGTLASLSSPAEFIPNHSPQRGLQRLLCLLLEVTERIVDERLVVAATGFINCSLNHSRMSLSSRIVTRVFRGGTFKTGPRLPLLKSYSLFMSPLRIAASRGLLQAVLKSFGVAHLAKRRQPREFAPEHPYRS